jgi:hypothetical protein
MNNRSGFGGFKSVASGTSATGLPLPEAPEGSKWFAEEGLKRYFYE